MKIKSIICLAVSALLGVSGCMVEEEMRVTGVTITPPVLNLRVGTEGYLYATVTPSNAAHPEVNWATSNEFAATVTAGGREDVAGVGVNFAALVHAGGEGKTTITATTIDGRKVATATINVYTTTDAKKPVITAHPQGDKRYEQYTAAEPLVVEATSPDGGDLSYQWYSRKANEDGIMPIPPGEPIPGATGTSYTPSTNVAGETRYCVIVTNTNNSIDGNRTNTAQSDPADIYITPSSNVTHAAKPVITGQPEGASYAQGAAAHAPLTVVATSPDNGTLSYKWYINTTDNPTNGTPLGVIVNTYTPPLLLPEGTYFYYAVVTNTNNAVNGNKTDSVASQVACIKIVAPDALVNAAKPVITVQPKDTFYVLGDTPKPLTVVATITDEGTLSHQWYSNSTSSNAGGTPLTEATTDDSYTPTLPTTKTWYYVVVTNTNNAAIINGSKTDTVISRAAAINIVSSSAKPTIDVQPLESATYEQGIPATPLSVTATSPDGGRLSYEWFRNTAPSTTGGTSVETSRTYRPPVNIVGTFYYYVVVKNTLGNARPDTVTSKLATITITPAPGPDAEKPTITKQPKDTTYEQGATASYLTVEAKVDDGGDLSYEWFKDNTSFTTNQTFRPPTNIIGTTKYYVVVTNRNGFKTTTTKSDVVTITVTYRNDVWAAVADSKFGSTAIRGIAANNTEAATYQFVAVGVSGKMAYSSTGSTWVEVTDSKFGNHTINGIASCGNKWVAVGDVGRMASSINGADWAEVDVSEIFDTNTIRGVASAYDAAGQWVAVGDDGKMARSTGFTGNSIDWESVTDSKFGNSTIRGIAYGNGRWVAVGDGGKIAYSDDHGGSWTRVSVALFNNTTINGVAYGADKWFAVGNDGKMAQSPDGINWSGVPDIDSIFTDHITGIAFGNNKWVAVGTTGKMAYSEYIGNTWTAWTAITDHKFETRSNNINGIAFGYTQSADNQWVAVGQAGKMAHGSGDWGGTWGQ